jgi:phenylacetate-CoA ligase
MNYPQNLSFESKEAIAEAQLVSLRHLLSYLQAHSPFYQKLFKDNDIDIRSIQSVNDLSLLPTTTKDDFSAHNFDFLCVPRTSIAEFTTTSGTTGSPVTIALTEDDLQRLAYNEEQSFVTAGCTPGNVFQLMLTLDRQFMAGMAYYSGIRKLGGGVVRVGAVSPQTQWENILRFKPDVMVAVPSFIIKLIEYAEQHSIDYKHCSVTKAICIGEPVRFSDLSPNTLADRIAAKWNIQLYSTYASTEMQTAFTECEYGCGGHLRPELLIVEILDEEGNQLPAGEFGEVTITTLGVEGMPLLRYRTGDICCTYDEPCACGRNTMRLSPVTGRKNQMIKYKGTTLFPPAVYDALSTVPQIKDYLIEVSTNELGNDDILIHIAQSGNLDEVEPQIKHALQGKLRVIPSLQFTSSAVIRSMRPVDSRKPVMIIFK